MGVACASHEKSAPPCSVGLCGGIALSIDMVPPLGGAGGRRVRTAEEFRALLEAGGLTLTEIIPTASALNVIEARPRAP